MRGISDKVKRKAIFEEYRGISDFLIIQETHSCPEYEQVWGAEWGGDMILNHGTSSARGIAVLMKKGMLKLCKNIVKSDDGRTIIFDFMENDILVTFVAVYAPNKDTPEYFRYIRNMLEVRAEHKVVIGDFNLTLDVELDRKNTYNNNNRALNELENMMDEYCLQDTWRMQNGERREYSWFKTNDNLSKASRIDFALVSAGIDQKVKTMMYLASKLSDHRPMYMVLDLEHDERGGGYWKLNSTYLHDINYVQRINEEIETTIKLCNQKSCVETGEIIKVRVKKASIDYAKNRTSEEKVIISNLSEKVNDYQSNFPLSKEDDELLQKTIIDLEERILERAKGMLFRSKVKWYELGEKNNKYFFNLEKARYNAKTCFKIIDENGVEVTGTEQILETQYKYYKKLYDVDQDVEFGMENRYGIQVPTEIKLIQDEQISQDEVENAIKTMNSGKTPGQDGLPAEFYKIFWVKIKGIFMKVIQEVYDRKRLHETARKGILNLIPKPNKDSRQIKNLRPITLLNTDYKIIEKAIANKMIPALQHIIHKDQRGFMKERRISVNIRKMLDIMHHAEKEDLEAVILSLDFVKCFDKCSFSILHGSLDFFGFSEVVKVWTEILYDDFSVSIQNNGHFSSRIPIKKGVHQGGCCSSVYFLVIAEILALALRDNENIEGITIKDIKNILNQFADDMDIFSLAKEKSIRSILDELNRFHKHSGFTVSYDKTTLYRIGSLRHSDAQLYNMDEFVWSNQDINVLGVTIAHENLVDKNYTGMLDKVRQRLNSWQNRGLSLLGKVQIVNTLIASMFVYKMMVLPTIPPKIVKQVDNMIRRIYMGW